MNEMFSFAFPGEISATVTGENRIEKLKMVCHLPGELLVAGRRENNQPALPMLGPEVFEKDFIIRKECYIEPDAPGNFAL